ncbi:uncharacterized protein LOC119728966 [Patiria miniata]|uniref:MYND-type domain-containing protein n=1 Tax=Patiria miniata TaxID=46514 RepID=A0A914A169_PATMI|nr:uncharacterized protein LOC119728966 [Patiria miniata]
MDVKRGHCWRCERQLPEDLVRCSQCPQAEYCSRGCLQEDRVRHGSVECQNFGPKRCSQCGKQGKLKECAGCNNAWYCHSTCQMANWPTHKQQCKLIESYIKEASMGMRCFHSRQGESVSRHPEPPVYIGNTIASDFLRLEENEWSGLSMLSGDMGEDELKKNYNLLSIGCGDLRSTVLTVASLPAKYLGNIQVTLDDLDPFVMARNVMFLAMMVRYSTREGIASSLATIWYSVLISASDYDLIKDTLQELVKMSQEELFALTHGLVTVSEADLRYLQEVWEGWLMLKCNRKAKDSINLQQQRKRVFDSDIGAIVGIPQFLNRLSRRDAKFMKDWFGHGLFLPTDKCRGNSGLDFDNPTLTGRTSANVLNKTPKEYDFAYCIRTDQTPFIVWDCLRVDESTEQPLLSVMARYHDYVTKLLRQTINFISQGRLTVNIFLAHCLDFPNHHLTLNLPHYDRIFTSNLLDYVGLCTLLKVFKPLLNHDNMYSTIVNQALNWIGNCTPHADVQKLPPTETFKYQKMCRQDTGFSAILATEFNNNREYYNTTHWFLAYLRAEIMAGGVGTHVPATDHVPKLNEVMHYGGLRMRDFRKGRNKLMPFQYRVNARRITMVDGHTRNVEWCLPEHKSSSSAEPIHE